MEQLLALLLSLQQQLRIAQQMHHARPHYQTVRTYTPTATVTTVSTQPAPAPTQTVAPSTQQVSQPVSQPTVAPTSFATQVEQYVLADTNAFRAQNGLPALTADAQLASIARAHSADMLANNYFAHNALNGCDPGCRLTNAGYPWRSYGENIHWMSGYNLSAADSAQKIVNDWINSPPHRENLLGSFTYAGIGIVVNGSKIESTADYATK